MNIKKEKIKKRENYSKMEELKTEKRVIFYYLRPLWPKLTGELPSHALGSKDHPFEHLLCFHKLFPRHTHSRGYESKSLGLVYERRPKVLIELPQGS